MFYIDLFNLSLLVYLYRPFPWTRYVSVLFPIQIMVADWVKDSPRLAAAVVMGAVGSPVHPGGTLQRPHACVGEP